MKMARIFLFSAVSIWRMVAVLVLLPGTLLAQQTTISSAPPEPRELVRKAVENEIQDSKDASARFMFRSTKTTPKGSVTKIYVQAKEALAGMVVGYNNKPLTPDQRQAELARIERVLNNPEELEKKHRQEQQDTDRTMRIVRALPDAFLYEYAGEQLGSAGVGKLGHPLVVLKFKPNPRYEPPSRIEQVLTGMEGVLMLDARRSRLASIDGTLIKDVSFGWGILGHLDKGGHVLVQHQVIGDSDWAVSSLSVDVTGKILLFKSLVFNMKEVFSDFKPVAKDVSFAQAVELLEKEEAVFAQNFATGKVTQ